MTSDGTISDRRRHVLERLPVLTLAVAGAVLTVGVLAGSEAPQRPAWYEDATQTAGFAPVAEEPGGPSVPPAFPVGEPDAETSTSAANVEVPPQATPAAPLVTEPAIQAVLPSPDITAWRAVAGFDAWPGTLLDVDVVRSGESEVFVAAGADGGGAVVVTAAESEPWRALGRDGLGEGSYARAVAASATDVVLAGGDDTGPAVWELDGESWRRSIVPAWGAGVVLADVAIRDAELVVVGFDRDGTGIWSRADADEPLVAVPAGQVEGAITGRTVVRGVEVVDGAFVAVGQVGARAHRWTSIDGRDWVGGPLDDVDRGATPTALAPDGTVAGYDGSGALVWQQGDDRLVARAPAPTAAPQLAGSIAARAESYLIMGRDAGVLRCWMFTPGQPSLEPCPASDLPGALSVGGVSGHRGGWLAVGTRTVAGRAVIGVWRLDDDGGA